eukprot:scaffold32223_cov83-Cyclotella_meneghiniana.AAC.3
MLLEQTHGMVPGAWPGWKIDEWIDDNENWNALFYWLASNNSNNVRDDGRVYVLRTLGQLIKNALWATTNT